MIHEPEEELSETTGLQVFTNGTSRKLEDEIFLRRGEL